MEIYFGKIKLRALEPDDMESLSRMVEDISYNNAKNYFKFY